MINSIRKDPYSLPESPLGYVKCIDDKNSSSLKKGQVYVLTRDTYKEDGEHLVDIIIPDRGILHGFWAYRFVKYIPTNPKEALSAFK